MIIHAEMTVQDDDGEDKEVILTGQFEYCAAYDPRQRGRLDIVWWDATDRAGKPINLDSGDKDIAVETLYKAAA